MAKASIQMINKTESGNNELYPITRDKEVKVVPSTSNNLPSSASNANDVFNSLGKLAFADTVDIESEINDEVTSTDYSWSGSKVNEEIEAAKTYADGKASSALSSANSYADNKDTTVLNNAKSYANGLISDTETATNKLWSSTKTDDTITNKTAEALNTAKDYADTQDSVILKSAKEYTDLRLTGDGSALAEHAAVVGNSTTPGHVKLSDKYTESDGDSASSVGASSKAVYDAYTALNTEITGIKTAMNTTDGGFATKTYVANLIAANLLKKEIVDSLPTENISSNTIYLVAKENGNSETNDIYNEYINLTGTSSGWEFLGNTTVDLTDYYKKNEVNAIIQENNNTVTTNANSYADGKAASALADAKSYADTKDETTLTSAKGYADTKTASALADAKTYASGLIKDTETTTSSVWSGSKTNSTISSNLSTAKSYADGKASSALADAKSYTDSSLATLEVSLVYLSEELGEKDFPAEQTEEEEDPPVDLA